MSSLAKRRVKVKVGCRRDCGAGQREEVKMATSVFLRVVRGEEKRRQR